MRTLLIDGDIFAYRAACVEEKVVEFDGVFMTMADAALGIENLDIVLAGMKENLGADQIVVALTPTGDTTNFRRGILPTYKESRTATKRPMILEPLKQHLIDAYDAKTKPTLEADDVLGILATNPKLFPGEKVIVTVDKDLRTVPGLHWSPLREGMAKDSPFAVTAVDLAAADRMHLFQTLVGDRVDNYVGCPGVGPVKANRILDADCSWAAVVAAFEKAKRTEEDALVQAQVARICRHSDYDYTNKRPIPWTPA